MAQKDRPAVSLDKAALYADDLVIWCKEEYATTATYRILLAADKLKSWTEKWCVAVNKDKSSTILFTLSPKQKDGTTYLGITFDKILFIEYVCLLTATLERRKLDSLAKLK